VGIKADVAAKAHVRDTARARLGEHPRGGHAQERGGLLGVQEGALDLGRRRIDELLREMRRKGRSEGFYRGWWQWRTGSS